MFIQCQVVLRNLVVLGVGLHCDNLRLQYEVWVLGLRVHLLSQGLIPILFTNRSL